MASYCYALPPPWCAGRQERGFITFVANKREKHRGHWLAYHLFETLDEIQDFAMHWLWTYNYARPNICKAQHMQGPTWPPAE